MDNQTELYLKLSIIQQNFHINNTCKGSMLPVFCKKNVRTSTLLAQIIKIQSQTIYDELIGKNIKNIQKVNYTIKFV